MKILVSGLINIETTVKTGGFPIEYSPIDYNFYGVNSAVSGVGYNICLAEKKLGNDVYAISILGKDANSELITNEFKKAGINMEQVVYDMELTPTSAVLYDDTGRRKIYCDLKDIQDRMYEPERAKKALKECDIAVICNINFNRELLKLAKEMNKTIVTDVHVLSDINDSYNRDFMEYADIIFLSDENIGDNYREFLYDIVKLYSPKVLVLGRGSKGAVLYDGEFHEYEAVSVGEVVNTVGAGDALLSAFVNYYAKGFKPDVALKKAQIFASYKIGTDGASKGFADETVVEDLYVKFY